MRYLRRIRRFLYLTQADIERATGIPVARLSKVENGRAVLTQPEETLVTDFLRARARVLAELEVADLVSKTDGGGAR